MKPRPLPSSREGLDRTPGDSESNYTRRRIGMDNSRYGTQGTRVKSFRALVKLREFLSEPESVLEHTKAEGQEQQRTPLQF